MYRWGTTRVRFMAYRSASIITLNDTRGVGPA